MENKNLVKRKAVKKIRTQPVEVHWTQFEVRSLPPGKQQEIADELMEYVNKRHKYTILGFLGEKKLSRSVWSDWCKKYPIILRAVEQAKIVLGAKRFDAAASKEGSEKLLQWAGQYDVDSLEFIKLLEDMKVKKDEQKAPTNITINMADFGDDNQMHPHMIPDSEEN